MTEYTQFRSKHYCGGSHHKPKKEYYIFSCLFGAGKMLFFMVEQVFLLMGEIWSMPNVDIQCTVQGREETKGQRTFFMFKFFLSCHKIWILFHNILLWTQSIVPWTFCSQDNVLYTCRDAVTRHSLSPALKLVSGASIPNVNKWNTFM